MAALPLLMAPNPAIAQSDSTAVEAQQRDGVQEIIVTAQKREQSIIDVPAAISAFSGDKLAELNVQNLPDVTTRVPNFSVGYERGENSIANFTLRGVSGAALASRLNESSVAVYSDGVFLGDETAVNGGLFDVERVEVLRGPQGTVFGKNTTGGLVHFISRKPTEVFSGNGSLQYGSDNEVIVEGAISGPITQGIRARIAGKFDRNDGRYRNRYLGAGSNGVERKVGDKELWGVRGIIDIDLSEKTLLRLIGSYSQDNSQTAPGITYGALLPGTTGPGPYPRSLLCSGERIRTSADCISDVQATIPAAAPVLGREPSSGITNLTRDESFIRGRGRSVTANLTHDFDWATLTSVTNYIHNDYRVAFDADAGATPSTVVGGAAFDFIADYTNEAKQFSQELRLNGSTDTIDWITGVFFYKDDKSSLQKTILRSRGLTIGNSGRLKTTSYAAFAQIDADISDQLTFSIGGRYTKEDRELVEATTFADLLDGTPFIPSMDIRAALIAADRPVVTRNKDFTGKFSITWEPNPDNSFYASYSRGIKGAGFNTGFSPTSSLAANIATAGPVGQEVLDAFEIGAKNRLFDRKLSINSAIFYYDFQGKQEQVFSFDSATSSVQQNYLNVGNAEIYGFETELNYSPSRYFDFNLSGGLLHAKVSRSSVVLQDTFGTNIPLQGLDIPGVPDWSFSSYVAYHMPIDGFGELTFQPELRGIAKTNYSITNDPIVVDDEHFFVSLRVLWKSDDGQYNAQAFVTNLFEEQSLLNPRDVVLGNAGRFNVTEGLGRLWGVKLGMNF